MVDLGQALEAVLAVVVLVVALVTTDLVVALQLVVAPVITDPIVARKADLVVVDPEVAHKVDLVLRQLKDLNQGEVVLPLRMLTGGCEISRIVHPVHLG